MSDKTPFVECNYTDTGEPTCLINDKEYVFVQEVMFEQQFIHLPENINVLVEVLNHFAMGKTFDVIEDIDGFNAKFRETYEAEEEQPWDQFNPSVSDFTMPDLDLIKLPVVDDAQIEFFVKHRGLGIPYKVSGYADGRGKLEYVPM